MTAGSPEQVSSTSPTIGSGPAKSSDRHRAEDIADLHDDRGNRIVGSPRASENSWVEFKASNCTVVFGERVQFRGKITFVRDNATVTIADGASVAGLFTLGEECTVSFGANLYCGTDLQIVAAEKTEISIGDDVLISDRVRIRTDDSHPIYDGVTGKRINPSRSVMIGDNVWLGQESHVGSGGHVGAGSVVGVRSLVTHSYPVPPDSIAVGTPARVVRRNIRWTKKHLRNSTDIPDSIPAVFARPRRLSRLRAMASGLRARCRRAVGLRG